MIEIAQKRTLQQTAILDENRPLYTTETDGTVVFGAPVDVGKTEPAVEMETFPADLAVHLRGVVLTVMHDLGGRHLDDQSEVGLHG